MDAATLRISFRDFAGQDRYRKFVRTINRQCRTNGRLFFWQEQLWREFLTRVSEAPASEGEIMNLFRVCDIHDCDLAVAPENEAPPEVRHTAQYDDALEKLFPFASGGKLVCGQCQAERSRWIAENADLCRILRKKTTYADYCDRLLEGIIDQTQRDLLKQQAKEQLKKREAEIAAEMEPGDELWEWDGGGWHQLAGRGGVAIVRNGQIVRKWFEIRS